MTLNTHTSRLLYAVLAAAMLAGCASRVHRAPVVERDTEDKVPAKPPRVAAAPTVSAESVTPSVTTARKTVPHEKDWRPQTYVVQKGDTLYSIAFNHGLDYHELAELNGIQNPGMIKVGQEIRLLPDNAAAAVKPVPEAGPAAETRLPEAPIKGQPKVVKLPYSEQAVAEIEKMQEAPRKPELVAAAKVESRPEPKTGPDAATGNTSESEEDVVEWGMPTNGKVIGEFSESANQKGIDVAGKRGQAVVASAAGKVVYSGSGLRGYGKLVIIKHNKTYLSAYAHNDQVLVKEGQNVTKGQKIAEMGSTDTDQIKLHFEIRKLGKPVDPGKYLPLVKS
ncbi:MAG: peptidoglycan DD-metalloendopeptidase family protein [Gallionellaceae bacterium]|nr:peptidoglycan DD-metalloendopeptidase family protein [Gallionellaceae bacterium]